MNFASLLELHARSHPDAVALEESETGATWTWDALTTDMRAVSAGLANLGLGPGDPVGIAMRNSADFVRAFLGIVALGGLVVPLNTRYLEEEMEFVLRDAGARTLIHDHEFAAIGRGLRAGGCVDHLVVAGRGAGDDAAPAGTGAAAVATLDELIASAAGPRAVAPRRNDDPLVLIYTSGSTGRPKGVTYHHGLYRDLGTGMGTFFGLHSGDCGLAMSPMFHMSGQLVLSCALAIGGRIVTMTKWDPAEFVRTLDAHRVSFMHMITTLMVDVTKLDAAIFEQVDTSSMRMTWLGGGATGPELIEEYERRVDGIICEGWGRSEGGLSWNPPDLQTRKLGSNGLVMTDICEIKVVDEDGEEVPTGTTGQMITRGDTNMRGYWKRPDLDAQMFRDDGWLLTGDLANFDEDGFLYFHGRIDHMIKTGGENVYPAEIEETLLDIPGVIEAAVIGLPDVRLGNRVTAAVVTRGDDLSADEIEEWCRERLAGYKRPRTIVLVDHVPRLANHKCDYTAVRRLVDQVLERGEVGRSV